MESSSNLERIVCPTCQVEDTTPFIPFGPKEIVRCRRCGLVYVNPRRLASEVNAFFAEQYIPSETILEQDLGSWRAPTLRREAELARQLKPQGRILDVGCAGGEFLGHFLAGGWECFGVEPATIAAQVASKRGITIYRGTLQEVVLPEANYYDLVTYLDALCFSRVPMDDFGKIYRALKDDGLFFIELPGLPYRVLRNVGPISWLVYRRWCHFSTVSPHLFYFSTSSLAKMLNKAGFQIESIHLEQSPLRNQPVARGLNQAYFEFAKLILSLTRGRLNLAAKVVYVCSKRK